MTPNIDSEKMIKLVNVATNQEHKIKLHFMSNLPNQFNEANFKDTQSQCISTKCALPASMMKAASAKQFTKNSIFSQVCTSTEWNLIFRIGSISTITALNPECCCKDTMTYFGYNYQIQPAMTPRLSSRIIYNKHDELLYKFDSKAIFCLDLRGTDSWYLWVGDVSPKIQEGASLCMVDNNRFIACINQNEKQSYLYALNETKLSIRLDNACKDRFMNHSLYHDKWHKIITVGDSSTEWYDLNKNKSTIVATYTAANFEKSDIWYSSYDPAILYVYGKEVVTHYLAGSADARLKLFAIDLRNGKSKLFDCNMVIPNVHDSKTWCSVNLDLAYLKM